MKKASTQMSIAKRIFTKSCVRINSFGPKIKKKKMFKKKMYKYYDLEKCMYINLDKYPDL